MPLSIKIIQALAEEQQPPLCVVSALGEIGAEAAPEAGYACAAGMRLAPRDAFPRAVCSGYMRKVLRRWSCAYTEAAGYSPHDSGLIPP